MECLYDSHGKLVAYRNDNILFDLHLNSFGQVWEDSLETFDDAKGQIVFNLNHQQNYFFEQCRGSGGVEDSVLTLNRDDYLGEIIEDSDGHLRFTRNAGGNYMAVNPPFNLQASPPLTTQPSCSDEIEQWKLPEGYCNIQILIDT